MWYPRCWRVFGSVCSWWGWSWRAGRRRRARICWSRIATVVELAGARRCRDVRTSVIYRSEHRTVSGGCLHMLVLLGRHAQVTLLLCRDLLRSWPRGHSAASAVVADAAGCAFVDHRGVVDIVDDRGVHVCHGAVIEILA